MKTANEALNYLAGSPAGVTTLPTSQADKALLDTGGWMLARGYMYDVQIKRLSAKVSRISLKRRVYA